MYLCQMGRKKRGTEGEKKVHVNVSSSFFNMQNHLSIIREQIRRELRPPNNWQLWQLWNVATVNQSGRAVKSWKMNGTKEEDKF